MLLFLRWLEENTNETTDRKNSNDLSYRSHPLTLEWNAHNGRSSMVVASYESTEQRTDIPSQRMEPRHIIKVIEIVYFGKPSRMTHTIEMIL